MNVNLILDAAFEQNATVAELEYLGLNNRFINILEERGKIVYLRDLIDKDEIFFKNVCYGLGKPGVEQIKKCLEIYEELPERRIKRNQLNSKVEKYKKQLTPDYFKSLDD